MDRAIAWDTCIRGTIGMRGAVAAAQDSGNMQVCTVYAL
jgi:hypothetical protein